MDSQALLNAEAQISQSLPICIHIGLTCVLHHHIISFHKNITRKQKATAFFILLQAQRILLANQTGFQSIVPSCGPFTFLTLPRISYVAFYLTCCDRKSKIVITKADLFSVVAQT